MVLGCGLKLHEFEFQGSQVWVREVGGVPVAMEWLEGWNATADMRAWLLGVWGVGFVNLALGLGS